jgi:alpha-glucosidase
VLRDETNFFWNPPFGERATVFRPVQADGFRRGTDGIGRGILFVFRAYNAGSPSDTRVGAGSGCVRSVTNELTEFVFTPAITVLPVYAAQGEYKPEALSAVKKARSVLTVETAEGPVAAIGEAALVDFARMKFACPRQAVHAQGRA